MLDYHVHTSLCKHAVGEMEEYVQAAIDHGITEMCFTDHAPLPDGMDKEHRMEEKDMEPYLEQIAILNRKYRDISLLSGVEIDYMEGSETYYKAFLSRYHFDLVIGSVHFIRKWGDGQWVFNFDYSEETLQQQYRDYFEVLINGIQTGLFDVVGHLDLIKRPGFPVMDTNRKDVEKVLAAVKAKGMSIELNTSGLRKHIGEIYPAMKIIEMVIKKQIPIAMASDAHRPEHVGYRFDQLLNRLFQYNDFMLAHYRKRKCISRRLAQPDTE